MISLRKTVNQMEQLDDFKRAAIECEALSIGAVKEYAVEVDAAQVADFRERLQVLKDRLKPDTTAEQLRQLIASFTEELREYSRTTNERIQRLRKDVQAASQAVEVFAENIATSSTGLDSEMKRELKRLEGASQSDNLSEVRGIIKTASAAIGSSFDRMQSANKMAIAQLKDEIRLLHQEVETTRKWNSVAQSLETSNQQEMFQKIGSLLRQKTAFSLILIAVRNLRGLESCHPKPAIESALASMHVRFQNALPKGSATGRWMEAQFVASVIAEPAAAMQMSRELSKKLSGVYVVEGARSVNLEVTAGVIDWKARSEPSSLRRRLEQLSEALARV